MTQSRASTHIYHAPYTVSINWNALRGYFEHDFYGEELGGGLWFEVSPTSTDGDTGRILELVDYDGVLALPATVIELLRKAGIVINEEFT